MAAEQEASAEFAAAHMARAQQAAVARDAAPSKPTAKTDVEWVGDWS